MESRQRDWRIFSTSCVSPGSIESPKYWRWRTVGRSGATAFGILEKQKKGWHMANPFYLAIDVNQSTSLELADIGSCRTLGALRD